MLRYKDLCVEDLPVIKNTLSRRLRSPNKEVYILLNFFNLNIVSK